MIQKVFRVEHKKHCTGPFVSSDLYKVDPNFMLFGVLKPRPPSYIFCNPAFRYGTSTLQSLRIWFPRNLAEALDLNDFVVRKYIVKEIAYEDHSQVAFRPEKAIAVVTMPVWEIFKDKESL